ncbi:MAG TPA: AraC family transcriptional regulator [Burkholderiales bacterium]|nr:AraC family transcriptional regulator [Burkholderiales bacterium]
MKILSTRSIFGAAAVFAAALAAGTAVSAETPKAPPRDPQGLDTRIQSLKQEAMEINRDLLVLEEELLFPASTQVAVFVSVDVGALFDLDSVELKLDDSVVSNYLYTERELRALHRGGVQRLYMGNLKTGKHELVAVFTGKGPRWRDYRRGATLKFDKGTDPKYIELQIRDDTRGQQPEFKVKEW